MYHKVLLSVNCYSASINEVIWTMKSLETLTNLEYALQRERSESHLLQHRLQLGRKRIAMSNCSGCHAFLQAPYKIMIKIVAITFLRQHGIKTYLAAWIPSHVEANLMSTLSLVMPCSLYMLMSFFAFSTLASVSNDNLKIREIFFYLLTGSANEMINYLASTSVETRPGTILRISVPKRTNNLSIAASSCSSVVLQNKVHRT